MTINNVKVSEWKKWELIIMNHTDWTVKINVSFSEPKCKQSKPKETNVQTSKMIYERFK